MRLTFLVSLVLLTATSMHASADERLRQRIDELSATVEDPTLPHLHLAAPDLVQRFYQDRGFALAWDDKRAAALVEIIADAETHGLDPDDYLVDELRALPPLATTEGVARIDADLVLTEALLRYGYHRRFGKVDPRELDSSWNYARSFTAGGPYKAIERVLNARDMRAQVDKEIDNGPMYEGLRSVLARYRNYVAAGGWQPVPTGPTLKLGMTDPRVALVRARLAAEGFDVPPPTGASETFDDSLTDAVRAFQTRHGLNDDGAIGTRTLEEMNVPATDFVDRLRINLERLRWVLMERTPRFVAVNIAGFHVYYIEDDSVRWSARAMVGRPYRQTPIFRADMKYLVLNPDWTVPPGILRKDKLPLIRKDPTYLQRQNMDVVDAKGNIVDPATIDWSQNFRYMLRQRPGPTNALGRVKFMFPNPHFVFLHDTPSRELFAREVRTFSSGCIRVENPLELADIVLKPNGGWNLDKLQRAVDTGVTQTISLKRPLPVLILYLTAIAFDGGRDYSFYRDVYGRDRTVLDALNAGFVYSAPDSGDR